MAPKGVSNRTLLAKKKGIRMGQRVLCCYREDGRGPTLKFEGIMADRRIGGTDRESYVELKKTVTLTPDGEIAEIIGIKRLIDAFIEEMDPAEPRDVPDALPQPTPAGAEGMAGMMPMGGMMPGMGMMGGCPGMMGMNPMMGMMGMNPMAMQMNPMMKMAMAGGMGMRPPMMGMPGMNPMMMNPMMGAMAMAAASSSGQEGGGQEGASGSADNFKLPQVEQQPEQDIDAIVEGIPEGEYVQVDYTHPQLGKTRYEGALSEKFVGGSKLQSYIDLKDSLRIGRSGHVREKEPTKRLMCAFVDGIKTKKRPSSRSRSRRRSRSRSPARS